MSSAHAPTRDARLIAFYVVVVAFMVVSIGGQIQTTAPRIGGFFAFLWSIGNDAGAMLALDCLMTAAKGSPVKKWAWVAILIAAGSGGAFNAYHVMVGVPLPAPARFPLLLGLVLGLESILMILVLSHIVSTERAQRSTGRREGRDPVVTPTGTPLPAGRDPLPVEADRAPSRAVGESTGALVATTGTPDRGPVSAGSQATSTGPLPRIHLAKPQPRWAPDQLVRDVVREIRATDGGRRNYGTPKLIGRPLPDGKEIGSKRAADLLAHVDELMARDRVHDWMETGS